MSLDITKHILKQQLTNNMPSYKGKKYPYDKEGYAAYIKALKKRRKEKLEYGDQEGDQSGY